MNLRLHCCKNLRFRSTVVPPPPLPPPHPGRSRCAKTSRDNFGIRPKYRGEPQNYKKKLLGRAMNGISTELKYAESQSQHPSQSRSLKNDQWTIPVRILASERTRWLGVRGVRGCNVVSCAVPVRNVSWMLFQEWRSSNLRLRRGVGQEAHAIIPTTSVLEFIVLKQWIMLLQVNYIEFNVRDLGYYLR